MRRALLALCAASFACWLPSEPPQHARFRRSPTYGGAGLAEASANFDKETAGAFLNRISPLIEHGFGPSEIAKVTNLIAQMPVDAEHQYDFPIVYQGESTVLQVVVHMDDIDAPDLSFFTTPPLAKVLNEELKRFFEELGW